MLVKGNEVEIVKGKNEKWSVVSGAVVLKSGLTNSQAWRELDILTREPISKSQVLSEWSFKRQANEKYQGEIG